jgi:hypothetical protein
MSGQGKMLAGRSRTSKTQKRIAYHAVQRFRERWPQGGHLSDDEVRHMILEQVDRAMKEDDWVDTPGGRFVPFCFMGEDGYAVIASDGNVTTLLFDEWCAAVDAVRTRRMRTQAAL